MSSKAKRASKIVRDFCRSNCSNPRSRPPRLTLQLTNYRAHPSLTSASCCEGSGVLQGLQFVFRPHRVFVHRTKHERQNLYRPQVRLLNLVDPLLPLMCGGVIGLLQDLDLEVSNVLERPGNRAIELRICRLEEDEPAVQV